MSTFFIKDPFTALEDFSKRFHGVLETIIQKEADNAYPLTNLQHDDEKIEVLVELPGIAKEDISLDLKELSLTISGERKLDESLGKVVLQERKFGKFSKTVRLPYEVELDSVDASYKDGLLLVKLGRKAEEKPKSIQIKIV